MKSLIALIVIVIPLFISHKSTERINDTTITNTNTCLPENVGNKEVLDSAITEPGLASIWTETNITGVTTQNVTYVLQSDPKCNALKGKYEFWIDEKYDNTNIKINIVTFHKYSDYYFVVMAYNNEGGYLMFGVQKLYILDANLDIIEGYGF